MKDEDTYEPRATVYEHVGALLEFKEDVADQFILVVLGQKKKVRKNGSVGSDEYWQRVERLNIRFRGGDEITRVRSTRSRRQFTHDSGTRCGTIWGTWCSCLMLRPTSFWERWTPRSKTRLLLTIAKTSSPLPSPHRIPPRLLNQHHRHQSSSCVPPATLYQRPCRSPLKRLPPIPSRQRHPSPKGALVSAM